MPHFPVSAREALWAASHNVHFERRYFRSGEHAQHMFIECRNRVTRITRRLPSGAWQAVASYPLVWAEYLTQVLPEVLDVDYISKAAPSDDDVKLVDHLPDPAWVKHWPAIMAFMTTDRSGVGGQNTTATLSIFAGEGNYGVCLNDRPTGCSLFRTGQSIDDALTALEKALTDGKPDWRRDRGNRKRKR